MKSKLNTKYAPAERATKEELEHQINLFKDNKVLNEYLSKIPMVFLIINKYRQIVYLNKIALEFSGLNEVAEVIGKRPGEMVGCIHSNEEEGGCGTSESCTYCGALRVVLESQRQERSKPTSGECQLTVNNGYEEKSFDLSVWGMNININREQFIIVTLQDIQDKKWRAFLERIFFHDILNTATGLKGTIELLVKYKDKVNTEELMMRAENITENLIEEIKCQQLLIAAENNVLEPSISSLTSTDPLNEIVKTYENHDLSKRKTIRIEPQSKKIEIHSDRTLLRRILSNMVINALEAVPENSYVTLGCELEGDMIKYWVHNPGYIPREIQLQIFNRSFSTKGKGRGLGTYSMKLLSRFLQGDVTFTTSKENGTTFTATYPIRLDLKL